MNQSQLPSHLQQYQPRDIGATLAANLGASMPAHVSIASNRFTLVDAANNEIPVPTFDPKLGPYLDACIVDVNDVMSRIYFSGQYDSQAEGMRPDCFSDNGIGPSVSASSPQAPTCAACPRSEWTKINANGNKVPWCTQKQKVALLIPGFDVLFLLAVPPNSHGPMREYVNHCKGNGVNIANLITRISFISQGTLQFQPLSYIDVAAAELRERAYAEKRTDALVGRTDTPRPVSQIAVPIQPAQPTTQQGGSFGVASPQAAVQWQPAAQTQAPSPTQQFVQNSSQSPMQQSAPQQGQWPQQTVQQVQQPDPFLQQTGQFTQPAGAAATNQSFSGGSAPFAGTPVQQVDQPATGRRKRRTQAEIAAANAGNGQQAPAGAPFPHPGQQGQPGPFAQTATPGVPTGTGAEFVTQPGTSAANQPGQIEFGIGQGQPAEANPNVQQALDSFFGKQG